MMSMKHAVAALPLLLGACAPKVADDPPIRDVEAGSDTPCSIPDASRFIGRTATQEVGAEILASSGAKTFQWVGPDTMVTMDFRPDRVRVSYDRDLIITRVACG